MSSRTSQVLFVDLKLIIFYSAKKKSFFNSKKILQAVSNGRKNFFPFCFKKIDEISFKINKFLRPQLLLQKKPNKKFEK